MAYPEMIQRRNSAPSPQFPSFRFTAESKRFEILCADQKMRNIGWRIAGGSWFLWRELYSAMHSIPKDVRKACFDYLRACQAERKLTGGIAYREAAQRWMPRARTMTIPLNPFSYYLGVAPMLLGEARIGTVVKVQRERGNIAKIFYKSDFDLPLELVKIDKKFHDRELWKDLGEEPLVTPVYHMRIKKIVAAPIA